MPARLRDAGRAALGDDLRGRPARPRGDRHRPDVVARRPDRQTILVGLAVLAIAFFVVPTRVHERYMFPFFAVAAILAGVSWRWLDRLSRAGRRRVRQHVRGPDHALPEQPADPRLAGHRARDPQLPRRGHDRGGAHGGPGLGHPPVADRGTGGARGRDRRFGRCGSGPADPASSRQTPAGGAQTARDARRWMPAAGALGPDRARSGRSRGWPPEPGPVRPRSSLARRTRCAPDPRALARASDGYGTTAYPDREPRWPPCSTR